MRCASPSTIAVLPTPALPTSAGLFLLWRSRMSITRDTSASRQRTGSRSPRRAWAVRSIPTRSSTSPVSNNPANGSLTSPAAHESPVPIEDEVAPDVCDGGTNGQKYPEWHETLFPERERHEDDGPEQGAGEDGEQHTQDPVPPPRPVFGPDEAAD